MSHGEARMTTTSSAPILLIPARLGSTRLPGKLLADLAGEPLVVHSWRRAVASGLGPVVVAAGEPEIVAAIEKVGGRAVLTDPGLASGSDRIAAALAEIDPDRRYDPVLNLQGDWPLVQPETIRAALDSVAPPGVDIGTLAFAFKSAEDAARPNFVKAVVELAPGARRGRALYFSRQPVPHGEGPLLHHIGFYAFRRAALERFVTLPRSELERREGLEQLRALAHGMRIDVVLVDEEPFGVDTPQDLEAARALFRKQTS
jgi:3-deoxy-manno-octulosonate cytidylyltransferase (CMP-KDO synthetase)